MQIYAVVPCACIHLQDPDITITFLSELGTGLLDVFTVTHESVCQVPCIAAKL